jgi:hypothetical protein
MVKNPTVLEKENQLVEETSLRVRQDLILFIS